MAFLNKSDYFKFSVTLSSLVPTSNSDGKSASVAEATDETGAFIANEVFGTEYKPTVNYVVRSNVNAQSGDITLGETLSTDIGNVCLNNVQITTQAGSAPAVKASGESVEAGDNPVQSGFDIPAFRLGVLHHAQTLFSAFTLSGAGCYLQSANYTFSATLTKATKDGVCVAHDVSEGRIDCEVSIIQTGNDAPTLTTGSGWEIVSPLACENPDADSPTWSGSLTYYLTRT